MVISSGKWRPSWRRFSAANQTANRNWFHLNSRMLFRFVNDHVAKSWPIIQSYFGNQKFGGSLFASSTIRIRWIGFLNRTNVDSLPTIRILKELDYNGFLFKALIALQTSFVWTWFNYPHWKKSNTLALGSKMVNTCNPKYQFLGAGLQKYLLFRLVFWLLEIFHAETV